MNRLSLAPCCGTRFTASTWRNLRNLSFALLVASAAYGQACPTKPPGRVDVQWNGRTTLCMVSGKPCVVGETIDFQITTTPGSNNYLPQLCDTVIWDFGDGTVEQKTSYGSAQAKHVYPNPGRYLLNVTMTNALGSWDMRRDAGTLDITISATLPCPIHPPNAGNYVTASCAQCVAHQPVTFTVASPNGEPEPCDKFEWNFGDGTTSTERSPSHTFAAAGTYPVIVKEQNGIGSAVTTGIAVTVSAPAKRRSVHR